MLINAKNLIYVLAFVLALAGCSTRSVINRTADHEEVREKADSIFNEELSDEQLFTEALSYLNNGRNEPNYDGAKFKLENLIAQYPTSKWIDASVALLTSLDRISTLQIKLKQEKQKSQGENIKLAKEIELLRDNAKQLEDKSSTEIARLQQENEQLKRDIQQLKNLEIQLEKREKMLR